MKNLKSLLMRLSALSLATMVMFSVATAAKENKALVQTPQTSPVSVLPADAFDRSVRIGSATNPQHLCVYDYVRAAGDLTSGAISQDPMQAGLKHIIGITKLDPRTQQFQIIFKDKSKCSHGAFVDLDFVTTVTLAKKKECAPCVPAGCQPCLPCKPKGKNECQSATNIVRAHDIYCHPTMTAGQIVATNGFNGEAELVLDPSLQPTDMAAPSTNPTYGYMNFFPQIASFLHNAAGVYDVKGIDMRLVPYVRVENLTKNVSFGFVPNDFVNYPLVATDGSGTGFYEDCWGQAGTEYNAYDDGLMNSSEYPEWSEGTLAYQVKSDCVAKVGVVNEVADSLDLPDLFELFSEDELTQLCGMLQDHFTNQEDMCRYIATNRFALSRAFKALN